MPAPTRLDSARTDLVVDARSWEPVLHALEQRDVLPSPLEVQRSAALDLVLVRGLRLEAYAAKTGRRYAAEVAASAGPSGPSGLDYLLHDLRRDFGERTGWVPVLGKNRDAVVGYPQHKGIKFPSSAARFELPRSDRGAGATVGVVDTPPVHHELLPAGVVDTDAWCGSTGTVFPWAGHGTFVAGLVRREAPGARIQMRTGLACEEGQGSCWDVAQAIAGFRGSGVSVLNLSFGCVTADNAPPLLLQRALARLEPDVLVICAAGNRGNAGDAPAYLWPAATSTAVAVGAAGKEAETFSMQREWVDVVAPGLTVTSAFLGGEVTLADGPAAATAAEVQHFDGYATWSGTSFAAATVTGKVVARMTEEDLSARDALDRLQRDPDSGVAAYSGQSADG